MLTIALWSGFAQQDKLVKVYSKLGGQLVGRISISKSLSMFDVVQDLCRQASRLMPHESLSARNLAIWVGSLRLTPPGFEFKESFTKQEEQEVSDLIDKARRGKRVDMMWDDNYEHACQVLRDHDITWRTFEEGRCTGFIAELGTRNTEIPQEVVACVRRLGAAKIVFECQTQVVRDMAFLECMQGVNVFVSLVQPTTWLSNLGHLTFNGSDLGISISPGISRCTKLRGVFIQNVKVLPEDFYKLKLQLAMFQNCDVHEVVDKLGNMQSLEHLDIWNSGCQPTLIPKGLGRLSSLKTLRLSYNKFVGAIPTEFGLLTSLTTLEVLERSVDLNLVLPKEVLALSIPHLVMN